MNDDALKRSAAARGMLQDSAPPIVKAVREHQRGLAKTERAVLQAMFGARAKLERSTTQSIADDTYTAITWTTETQNTDDMWSSGEPTRVTISTAGDYIVGGGCEFANNSTGRRGLAFYVNGVIVEGSRMHINAQAAVLRQAVSGYLPNLSVDDYIEFYVYQNSGGALNITNAAFWAVKV